MRSASGGKRAGAGAAGRGGRTVLELRAGAEVVTARDFNGESCKRGNCHKLIMQKEAIYDRNQKLHIKQSK